MRILHVLSSLSLPTGGPVIALRGLAKAQKAIGQEPVVVSSFHSSHSTETVVPALEKAGVAVHRLGPAWERRLNWFPSLALQLRPHILAADVIHLHGLWEEIQWQASRLAAAAGIPIVIRPCGMLDPWSLSQGRLHKRIFLELRLKRMISSAAAMHFTTLEECALARPLTLNRRALIEPNGIDLSDYQTLPNRGGFRRSLALTPETSLLLFLGRIHPKKGLPFLITALSQLTDSKVHLAVAGPTEDADHLNALKQLAGDFGLLDRIHFCGELHGQAKLEAYVDSDLFILPSHQENFGNAVLEALACGLPVVVSDKVNLCDFVKREDLGSVVPLDAARLADAIDELLHHPETRQRIAEVGRPLVLQQFDWRQIAESWQRHYEHLIKETPRKESSSR